MLQGDIRILYKIQVYVIRAVGISEGHECDIQGDG